MKPFPRPRRLRVFNRRFVALLPHLVAMGYEKGPMSRLHKRTLGKPGRRLLEQARLQGRREQKAFHRWCQALKGRPCHLSS